MCSTTGIFSSGEGILTIFFLTFFPPLFIKRWLLYEMECCVQWLDFHNFQIWRFFAFVTRPSQLRCTLGLGIFSYSLPYRRGIWVCLVQSSGDANWVLYQSVASKEKTNRSCLYHLLVIYILLSLSLSLSRDWLIYLFQGIDTWFWKLTSPESSGRTGRLEIWGRVNVVAWIWKWSAGKFFFLEGGLSFSC